MTGEWDFLVIHFLHCYHLRQLAEFRVQFTCPNAQKTIQDVVTVTVCETATGLTALVGCGLNAVGGKFSGCACTMLLEERGVAMVQELLRNLGVIIGASMVREEGIGLHGIVLGEDRHVTVEPPKGEAVP